MLNSDGEPLRCNVDVVQAASKKILTMSSSSMLSSDVEPLRRAKTFCWLSGSGLLLLSVEGDGRGAPFAVVVGALKAGELLRG